MVPLRKDIADFYDYRKVIEYVTRKAFDSILFELYDETTAAKFRKVAADEIEKFKIFGSQVFVVKFGYDYQVVDFVFHNVEKHFSVRMDTARLMDIQIELIETTYQSKDFYMLRKLSEDASLGI